MDGFADRLAAAKAKQGEAQERKATEAGAAEAAETAKREREGKKSELTKSREGVQAELSETESTAKEAESAIVEADAFLKEQGEGMDAEAKAEIDALKAEAGETLKKFDALKAEPAKIDAEITALETAEESPEKTEAVEATAEQSSEAAPVSGVREQSPEKPAATTETPAEAQTATEKIIGTPVKTLESEISIEKNPDVDPEDANDKVNGKAMKEYLNKKPLTNAEAVMNLLSAIKQADPKNISSSGLEVLREAVATVSKDPKIQAELSKKDPYVIEYIEDNLNRGENISRLRIPKQRDETIKDAVAAMANHEDLPSRRYKKLANIRNFADQLNESDHRKVYESLGPEFIKELKQLSATKAKGYPDAKPSLFRDSEAHVLRNFTRTSMAGPGIGLDLEKANPEMAEEYHEFILDSVAEELKQTKPNNEIFFVLPETLRAAYARLSTDKKLPAGFEQKLSSVLKALKKHPDLAPNSINDTRHMANDIRSLTGEMPSKEIVQMVFQTINKMME